MKDPSTIHPVHAALEQLDGLSKSSQLSDANVDIDEGRRLNIDRIFYITGEARKRLS